MSRNFQEILISELLLALEPLAGNSGSVLDLLDELGWSSAQLVGPDAAPVTALARDITAAVSDLRKYSSSGEPPQTFDELATALKHLERAQATVRALPAAMRGIDPNMVPQLGAEVVEYVLLRYLQRRFPAGFALMRVLTIVESEFRPELVQRGAVIREAHMVWRLRPDRIPLLLRDPLGHLKTTYLDTGLDEQAAVEKLAKTLLHDIAVLLTELHASVVVGRGTSPMQLDDVSEAVLTGTLTALWMLPSPASAVGFEFGGTLQLVPRTRGGPGVLLLPLLGVAAEQVIGDWFVAIQALGTPGGCFIGPNDVQLLEGAAAPHVDIAARVANAHTDSPLRLGSARGTRLEVEGLTLRAHAELGAASQDYGMELAADQAAIVIAAGDGDGFLQHVLPKDGIRIGFDFGIGWSNTKGLYFRGGAGLEATLPINLSLFDTLSLDSVYLALHADAQSRVRGVAAATTAIELGPVMINIERFGLEALLTFPPNGGNLAVAQLAVGFKPPSGAGLVIEAPGVKGGGYLFFDSDKGQYAGILQLELADTISIKAIGLLTTRMPDGSPGFSLLVIITAEGFTIQLGFGFTLTGIGGLLGVNRTAMVDALRSGIRTGVVGSIMFPVDPIRNAQRIVSDVSTVFPVAPQRYVFGPMVQIAWGTPTILTLELGIVLEVPDPIRLVILGRLQTLLPDAAHAVVKIRMDAIGVIDMSKGEISLDATLFDSRLLAFVLTGDMALRARVKDDPTFLLAVGGWHPSFAPPAGFPTLSRLAITLSSGDNARLRLESYLAVTSNTVQFGARCDFYFGVAGFGVEGYLGFDALFHFAPFAFIVDLNASVALRAGGVILTAVTLTMTLTGPTPWHVWGHATFTLLGFKQTVAFDGRFGADPPPALPSPVDLESLLRAALTDVRNWSGELPATERPLVAFRPMPDAAVLRVHPLTELAVRERIAPLDRRLDMFGNAPLAGAKRFALTAVRSDTGAAIAVEPVNDAFALAQFVMMSDDQKLSMPAFTSAQAGLRFATGAFAYGAEPLLDHTITYEMAVIAPNAVAQHLPPYTMPAAAVEGAVSFGAAANAASTRRPRKAL